MLTIIHTRKLRNDNPAELCLMRYRQTNCGDVEIASEKSVNASCVQIMNFCQSGCRFRQNHASEELRDLDVDGGDDGGLQKSEKSGGRKWQLLFGKAQLSPLHLFSVSQQWSIKQRNPKTVVQPETANRI